MSPENEHNWMLAAQEYYYSSALCADFTEALAKAVAQQHLDKAEKTNNMN